MRASTESSQVLETQRSAANPPTNPNTTSVHVTWRMYMVSVYVP